MDTVVDKADSWEDNEWYPDRECGMPLPEADDYDPDNLMVNWLADIVYWKLAPTYLNKMWDLSDDTLEIQIAVGATGLRISVINLDRQRVVDAMVVRYQAMAQCLRDYGIEKGFERLNLEPQMEELAARLARHYGGWPRFRSGLMSAFSVGRVVSIRRGELKFWDEAYGTGDPYDLEDFL